MPSYEWKCKECGRTYLYSERFLIYYCEDCYYLLTRVYSFSVKRSMPAHFNSAVGSYVSNDRQLRDQFKIKSEEASARTGISHDFQPVDLADRVSLGVTDEGLSSTYDRADSALKEKLRPWLKGA